MVNSGWFLLLSGVIFTCVLLKVYFSKKRLVSTENKIYKKLIVVSLVSLLLDVLNVIITLNLGTDSIVSVISTKVYLASILVWLSILTIYIYVFSFKKVEKFSLSELASLLKVLKVFIPLGILCLVVIFVLPVDLINKDSVIYFDGLGAYFLYTITFIYAFIWFLRYIVRINYIKKNKSNFILYILFVVWLGLLIQFMYPETLLFTFVMYFITFTMYFGIDNPNLELVKKLELSKKQAEETEMSTKDSLLKISHEIRTPLNTIAGFSQSILEGTSEDIIKDVQYIKEASDTLLNVTNNILDVSSVDMGMYKLVFSDYDFRALLDQIMAMLKEKIWYKQLAFNAMIYDNVPPFLFGDSIRIKEIILNVFYNAIKYTKEGYINLDIDCVTIGNICRLTISIKDTGIGITDNKLDNLFEFKPRDNMMLAEGISELSLGTIKEIVESMSGQITVESEYREGTNVTIIIDQKIGKDPNAAVSNTSENTEINMEVPIFSGKKVLVVDDDRMNLKVADRLLKNYGVIIDEVPNGYKCLEKIKNGEIYDLIFMDDAMPNMSGVETLKSLNRIEGFNIPTIALTANAMAGMKEKYLKEGFSDFIPKPIERDELDRIMKKFLNNQ